MSFSDRPDLSPQLVHKIGMEFCKKAFPDTKAVVSTHMNTDHLHNHMVISAYNMSTATKYKDNMDSLRKLRNISDELSLKYGLDIIVDSGLDDRKGRSYIENLERQRGMSWKEAIKQDIKKSVEAAGSWDEYKKLMAMAGYGIEEKPKTVTYYFLNDESRRVRDTGLGVDFTRDFIKELYNEDTEAARKERESERIGRIEQFKEAKRHEYTRKGTQIFVSRYTLSSRRRSDMELIFLAAIKLIKIHGNHRYNTVNTELFKNDPAYWSPEAKLWSMQQGMNMSIHMGIKNTEQLKEKKRECGKNKKILENELNGTGESLKALVKISDKIKILAVLEKIIYHRALDKVDIQILDYIDEDIRRNRAALQPMSPDQRRDLYVKLNEKGYRVTVKYDEITYSEGKQILDFLKGKDVAKTDILVTEKEYMQYRRDSYASKSGNQGKNAVDKSNRLKNYRFEKTIDALEPDDADCLYQYRALINELASLGYTADDFESVKAQVEQLAVSYNELKARINDLSWEYRNLCKIENSSMLAKDRRFTNDPIPEYENNTVYREIDADIEQENCRFDETTKRNDGKKYSRNNAFSLADSLFEL